ncbi:MAG: hypothetical protein U5L96_21470 [Owenweeksia sp.]|nr:hypothetical protein [Owenweeksia sp.]
MLSNTQSEIMADSMLMPQREVTTTTITSSDANEKQTQPGRNRAFSKDLW